MSTTPVGASERAPSELETRALALVEFEARRLGWWWEWREGEAPRQSGPFRYFVARLSQGGAAVRVVGGESGRSRRLESWILDPLAAVLWLALARLDETERVGPCQACTWKKPTMPMAFETREDARTWCRANKHRQSMARRSPNGWWGLWLGPALAWAFWGDLPERPCPACSGTGEDRRDLGRLVCEAAPRVDRCGYMSRRSAEHARERAEMAAPGRGAEWRIVQITRDVNAWTAMLEWTWPGDPVAREALTVVADRLCAGEFGWTARLGGSKRDRYRWPKPVDEWGATWNYPAQMHGWTVGDVVEMPESYGAPYRYWPLSRCQSEGLDVGEALALWLAGTKCEACRGSGNSKWLTTSTPMPGDRQPPPVRRLPCSACAGHGSALAALILRARPRRRFEQLHPPGRPATRGAA